jgi:hypothetical protein
MRERERQKDRNGQRWRKINHLILGKLQIQFNVRLVMLKLTLHVCFPIMLVVSQAELCQNSTLLNGITVNRIKFNQIYQSQIFFYTLCMYVPTSFTYCCHLVNGITFSLARSDPFKRLPLCRLIIFHQKMYFVFQTKIYVCVSYLQIISGESQNRWRNESAHYLQRMAAADSGRNCSQHL